jgi:hypothetical protein
LALPNTLAYYDAAKRFEIFKNPLQVRNMPTRAFPVWTPFILLLNYKPLSLISHLLGATTFSITTFKHNNISIRAFRITTLGIETFRIMKLAIMAFSIMTFDKMTLRITTFSMMAVSTMAFSIVTIRITTFSITMSGIMTPSILTLKVIIFRM